jgi:hypothetical protein
MSKGGKQPNSGAKKIAEKKKQYGFSIRPSRLEEIGGKEAIYFFIENWRA